MKMNKKKLMINLFAVTLSVALLIGSSLAYFTDRVNQVFAGHVGSVEIDSSRPFAKMPAIYDTMNDISLQVSNNGTKSMDIKAVVTISTPSMTGISASQGTHMLSDTIEGTNYTLPLYRIFDDDSIVYAVTCNNGTVTESETSYLTGTVSNGNVTFTVTGLLNGKDTGGDYEVETNGVDVLDIPLYIYFPEYLDADNWDLISKNIAYTVNVQVYGKQHRNTDDNDWTLLGVV